MTTRLLFVHALSPLHTGTGQSLGAIELAIARDRATGFPLIPGSSIKGALRACAEEGGNAHVRELFGPEAENASDHAGSLVLGDAFLLLLPARSVAGTWAWTTSPYLLRRLARDWEACGGGAPPPIPEPAGLQDCLVAAGCALGVDVDGQGRRVVLEDMDLVPKDSEEAGRLAAALGERLFPGDDGWKSILARRLCVVHDDVMGFLARTGTEVMARVSLDSETRTVKNLWHEEALPTESVLVSLAAAAPAGKCSLTPGEMLTQLEAIAGSARRLGGKATVGRGRCRLVTG